MRALQLVEWQQPPQVREVPEPEPGPGEVLVRIGAAGACHSDLHLIHDFAPGTMPWPLPFTLGHENAGWVAGLGDGVRGIEVDTPVAVYGPWGCGLCARCVQGLENYCERAADFVGAGGGLGADGGMATYMTVPSPRHLVPLGDLDPVLAAPLTDAGLTPYHAIKRSLALMVPGSTVVVIGVGGLGHMAVQILRALGPATVVAIDRSEDSLLLATEVGAHHTFLPGPSATDEVRALTRGQGADVVLDFVGVDETLALGASLVRPLGHLTCVGIGGGSLPFSFFTVPYECSLASTYWGSIPELVEVIALGQRGLIEAKVERVTLDGAVGAYDSMHAGTLHGRAVVVPDN
jgi:propanol-preferring alcohol dehydrogenase